MTQNEIEQYVQQSNYQMALDGLDQYEPSIWRDAIRLKCLRALGRRRESLKLAQHLAEQLSEQNELIADKDHIERARQIALTLTENNHADSACTIMQRVCELAPNKALLLREYSYALENNGQFDDAKKQLQTAIALIPTSASAHAQLAGIYSRIGWADNARNCYYRAATLEPNNPEFLQRIAQWSNYSSFTTESSSYQIAKFWASKIPIHKGAWTLKPGAKRILKIGLLSPNFFSHSHSSAIIPLLRGLDRKQFSVIAFSDTRRVDVTTRLIRDLCDNWRDVAKFSDSDLAEQIRNDQTDILIDLCGHTRNNRMGVFARRPSPLQISWLGYPSTTGLDAIGFKISDQIVNPIGVGDRYYTEKIIRLDNGYACYEPPANAPAIKPRSTSNAICFGSFTNLTNISELTIDCWAAVLLKVPNSNLYLCSNQYRNQSAQNYLYEEFKMRGIRAERITMEVPQIEIEANLEKYNLVDIALDTTPYNSTVTALEALWMGTPVITLSGNSHAGRTTASMLSRIQLGDLVCDSIDQYALTATKLSSDKSLLKGIRHSLRTKIARSAITNKAQFGSEFGAALREQWQAWCKHQGRL